MGLRRNESLKLFEANERDDRHQMLSRESLGPMHDLLAPTLRAMG